MKSKDNQRYIYIRSTRERIPVTEKEFCDYYREIDSFRRKQQRHCRCTCPPRKRLDCDADCCTCPYYTPDTLALDYTETNEKTGKTTSPIDFQTDGNLSPEESLAYNEAFNSLIARMTELMPQALEIGELRMDGLTEDAIAEKIGVGRKTYAYRLKKVAAVLKEEFPEFF